jgi:ESCRT-II complex subunit VPS36
MRSEPGTRPVSPDSDDESLVGTKMIKLSFRKGGDKAFYTLLKRSLKSKTWEVRR